VILESKLIQEPPVATSTIAYRIVQEALMNVRKHARAEHVNVRLAQSAGGLLVGITDDGRGFEPAASAPGHLGLVAMRERAEMAGGWFRIESDPTQGTAVDFLLPTIAA
jgi:signal transduction histidine kinase